MRLIRELVQIPACVIGLALVGGAISLVTAIVCQEIGVTGYQSIWGSARGWLRVTLLGAAAGGFIGFAWSANRCVVWPRPALETDDEVW